MPRAREPDIEKASGFADVVLRSVSARQPAFLRAEQDHHIEFAPLGTVQRRKIDAVAAAADSRKLGQRKIIDIAGGTDTR